MSEEELLYHTTKQPPDRYEQALDVIQEQGIEIARLTQDRDYYKRAFLMLSNTRKSNDIRSAR